MNIQFPTVLHLQLYEKFFTLTFKASTLGANLISNGKELRISRILLK